MKRAVLPGQGGSFSKRDSQESGVRNTMKAINRKRLSKILLITGAVLVVIGAGYEAINYPWQIVLSKFGMASQDSLPDPKPLEQAVWSSFPSEELSQGDPLDVLPAQGNFLMARPEVKDLTVIGYFKYPKLGVSENIVLGSGDELLYGVGHVDGTAGLGQEGNCVLAGHRNYIIMHPFRHLDKAEVGDRVTVEDENAVYTYEIYEILTVEPDDVYVAQLQEGETHMLTLVTCTPVLNPTHRLVAWCRLVETSTKA